MRVRAAVVHEPGGTFRVQDLELDTPRADELLVRIVAAGVCRTDLHIRDGEFPNQFPVVPGHEGAGVVEAVGSEVEHVRPGDHVVLSYPWCGACRACAAAQYPYCENGFALSFGGSRLDGSTVLRTLGEDEAVVNGQIFQQSSFATAVVVPAVCAVVVPRDLDLTVLAPMGCGVQTGAGVILNALQVAPGSTVAVLGCGSVGLSAVMASVIAGAGEIVAVDSLSSRLVLARELGATQSVEAGDDLLASVRDLVPRGLDYVIDTTASPDVLASSLGMLAMTGTVALVGGAPPGATAALDMNAILNGRRVRGTIQGDSVSQEFIPRLVEYFRAGLLPIDRLVTRYAFESIAAAVNDMESGTTIKPVLTFGD